MQSSPNLRVHPGRNNPNYNDGPPSSYGGGGKGGGGYGGGGGTGDGGGGNCVVLGLVMAVT